MKITAEQVKQLRDQTGAPMMECKKALEEAQGKLEDAFTVLRKRGQAAAAKRAGRATQEGVVGSYIHAGGKIGVIVELNCETDFVARTPEFKDLAHDLAMHIAAADPRFLQKEDVSGEALAKEREVIRAQAATSGKPPAVMERIIQGRLGKFYEEACLYEQHFVRDPAQTIGELIRSKVAKFGENINVSRFSRFKIGEWPNASSDHPKITSVSSH
jgi:elongation factor Ts